MPANKENVITTLDRHLATATDLFTQIKQAHWTVVGANFIALHELFDKEADLVRGYIDEYAERIRALGSVPSGTVRMAAKNSGLDDFPSGVVDSLQAVTELASKFDEYSGMLTDAIMESDEAGDLTTQDIYIEAQREIDRHAWFLRSHTK
jgi:starvation-inducible DNA-binding protein